MPYVGYVIWYRLMAFFDTFLRVVWVHDTCLPMVSVSGKASLGKRM